YQDPLPQFEGLNAPGSVEASYYTWVDQFDTLGLGPNTPISTGNGSEGPLALKDGQWVVLRVPYPLGFYAKWLDGRIDDPNAGWKGRGLWATVSTRAPFHMETGKGTTSKVLHFQLRPHPLARYPRGGSQPSRDKGLVGLRSAEPHESLVRTRHRPWLAAGRRAGRLHDDDSCHAQRLVQHADVRVRARVAVSGYLPASPRWARSRTTRRRRR